MTGAFAVGDISGGAFNPAVALGICILGISDWGNIWIYLLANFAAGLVAAVVFQLINPPMQVTPNRNRRAALRNPRLKPQVTTLLLMKQTKVIAVISVVCACFVASSLNAATLPAGTTITVSAVRA